MLVPKSISLGGLGMTLFLQTARHSPESCALHNEKVRKIFVDLWTKMPQLTKKYGIKVVGSWTSVPEHLIIMLYDAPNMEALLKFSMEPEVMAAIGFQTTETRPVIPSEEVMKMMK
jgi:uncharacterized protein with GYD domain